MVHGIIFSMAESDYTNSCASDGTAAADARRYTEELSASWKKAHEARSAEIQSELMKQHADAGADERLLLGLASHDVALAETLGRAETQLAERLLLLIDNVKLGLALAKTLKQVVACRDGATGRAQDLLQTAGVIRGQQKLVATQPLRRVA